MPRVLALALVPLLVAPALAQSQKVGDPPEAQNMRLVGQSDLQARSAYQPTIHRQGNRYIAYIGHHGGTPDVPKPVNKMTGQAEFNGTSILDVTDPANPKYLKHLPGLEGNYEEGGAQMVRVCDGRGLPKGDPNAVYAGSVPYLKLCGIVMSAWQMARAMLVSDAKRAEDPGFHGAKIATAQCYAEQILPQAAGLAHAIVAGAAAVNAMTEEQF